MAVLTEFKDTTKGLPDAKDTLNDALATIRALVQRVAQLEGSVAPTPQVFFTTPEVKVVEGSTGEKILTFTVKRTRTEGSAVVALLFNAGNTSQNDYFNGLYPGNRNVVFNDGAGEASFSISVNGDTDVETDESFSFTILPPAGYVAASPNVATGIILNDDFGTTPLQPPSANPVTAKVVGPATTADTGPQDLGGKLHSFHSEAGTAGDTGAQSISADLYLLCDTLDSNQTCGIWIKNLGGSQYTENYYFANGQWNRFPGGEAGINWGRGLLREDVIDISVDNGALKVFLNGSFYQQFPKSVMDARFPNGFGQWARYARSSGTYTRNITLSGGQVSPMTLINVELDGNGFARSTFYYTGTPLGYVDGLFDSTGNQIGTWKPSIRAENATKGQATYLGNHKAPKTGVAYTYKIVEADSTGAPKTGVTPISKSIVAPGPMTFGINVTNDQYSMNPRRNKVCNYRNNFSSWNYSLRDWADANPQMDALFTGPSLAAVKQIMIDNSTTNILTSGPNVSPAGTVAGRETRGDGSGLGPVFETDTPRLVGQKMYVRWKGVPDHISYYRGAYETAQNRVAGSDGTRSWVYFNHNYDPTLYMKGTGPSDLVNTIWRIKAVNDTVPTEIECFAVDENNVPIGTGYWDPDYVNEKKRLKGHTINGDRMMDCQRIIGMYNVAWTDAHIADGMSRAPMGGWGYEMCFSWFEAQDIGGQVHIPLLATEAFIRKAARKGAIWSARTLLMIYWELSNEIWNSGQPSWGEAVRQGKAAGITGASDHDICMKWHSFRQRQVMQWITDEYSKVAGASPFLARVITVQGTNAANARTTLEADALCLTYTDEIQVAPYLGNGYGSGYPKDAPSITDAMLDDYISRLLTVALPAVFGGAASIRDYAFSKGKSFGCYEGLLEDPQNDQLLIRLKNDATRFGYLVTSMLTEFKRLVGGHWRGYYDNSMKWGLRPHICQSADGQINGLQPAGGMKAFYDFVAAQPVLA